jgi:uncharacterized membrane protein YfcA
MEELSWYHYVLSALGGAAAGAVNTLAGNGSAITLAILTELIGLPGATANATNRIGIAAQSYASIGAYRRSGKFDLGRSRWIIGLMVLGSVFGMLVAVWISNEQFTQVFRFLMVFMLFVILIKPERWLRETDPSKKMSLWVAVPCFLALGFYGGFIQLGMGLFFLALMVLVARYSILESNVVKVTVTGIYTTLAILLFQAKGMINWPVGLAIALGQGIGGYATAHFAATHPKAGVVAHRLLVITVILVLLQLFQLPALFLQYLRGS